ncbi:MAG: hypothetical protein PHW63_08120 [Alphaproteobacteria bacterium]|nr:hypothetical protein [Alphaproteobacteria bacterium]
MTKGIDGAIREFNKALQKLYAGFDALSRREDLYFLYSYDNQGPCVRLENNSIFHVIVVPNLFAPALAPAPFRKQAQKAPLSPTFLLEENRFHRSLASRIDEVNQKLWNLEPDKRIPAILHTLATHAVRKKTLAL